MKNRITDLNDHLFAQLERLSDEEISETDLSHEVARTRAIVDVSEQIVRSADLALKAAKLMADHDGCAPKLPPMLERKREP
ncbi:hypothetical protein ABWH89_04945 [Hoeflea alexandrii]|uniref:hypothetical protein n=1 Tax=Hoeflea alexandrii TaxID=288436 RepID=UPI0035D1169D